MSSAIVFSAFLAFPLMYMRLHGFLNEFRNSSAITDHELYRNLKFNSP
nr:MAG TPA: Nematode cuticle collagen N-terminal domain [Caudoviricetes sp.]